MFKSTFNFNFDDCDDNINQNDNDLDVNINPWIPSTPLVITSNYSNSDDNNNMNASTKLKYNIVKRLESGGRILSLIKKAETKRIPKCKTVRFLQKKGVSGDKIIKSYSTFYKQEGLYEITFNSRPLGFSVIRDIKGKNAIVSSISNPINITLGMKVASRLHEINGIRVDGFEYHYILKLISKQSTPFCVIFKESTKRRRILDTMTKSQTLKWLNENDLYDSDSSYSSSIGSYSSDDDEAHVACHYKRKSLSMNVRKRKHSLLFRSNEMDKWDDDNLTNEQQAMQNELSRLMVDSSLQTINSLDDISHQTKMIAEEFHRDKLQISNQRTT